jgi:hypothetical protein
LKRLLAFLLLIGPPVLDAQSLSVRAEADHLRIGAPQLRLLTRDVLDRLRDGVSIGYTLRLALSAAPDGAELDQITYRCLFSYDLWEETFAVTRLEPSPRAISHLSASAAEAWCLDALTIGSNRLSDESPFWASLDYRADEPRGPSDGSEDTGLTLGSLIDIFSRKDPKRPINGSRQAGPFRLSSLRRK